MTDIKRLGLGCMGMNLSIELTDEDIECMEDAFPSEMLGNMHMRNLIFRDGRIIGR